MTDKITCPKCGSDQLTADKKGFSGKKAVAGALVTGGIGLLAGTIGSNKVKVTCLACGNSWEPKQYAEKKQEAAAQKEMAEMNYWKKEFYILYDSVKMAEAEEYYKLNSKISARIPNFHDGYKHLKKTDSQMMWIGVFIFAVFIAILYLIFR